MTIEFETVEGSELRVGDAIEVWWQPNRDQIVSLRPYRGPLEYVFPKGAQIAGFAIGPAMTIENDHDFKRVKAST